MLDFIRNSQAVLLLAACRNAKSDRMLGFSTSGVSVREPVRHGSRRGLHDNWKTGNEGRNRRLRGDLQPVVEETTQVVPTVDIVRVSAGKVLSKRWSSVTQTV